MKCVNIGIINMCTPQTKSELSLELYVSVTHAQSPHSILCNADIVNVCLIFCFAQQTHDPTCL